MGQTLLVQIERLKICY